MLKQVCVYDVSTILFTCFYTNTCLIHIYVYIYTETNSQRNMDLSVHFFVFIFIKKIFIDNTFRQ